MPSIPRPGVQGRRAQNKADKRARILAAARGLLEEVGYDRMTTAEVARRAEVAAGTIFQYAASKPELLMMVVEEDWRDVVADTRIDHGFDESTPAAQIVDAVLHLLEPFVAQASAHPQNTMAVGRELLFGNAGEHHDAVVAQVGELENGLAAMLAATGRDADRSLVAARLIVSGTVLELNRARRGQADEATVRLRVRDLVSVAVNGARA